MRLYMLHNFGEGRHLGYAGYGCKEASPVLVLASIGFLGRLRPVGSAGPPLQMLAGLNAEGQNPAATPGALLRGRRCTRRVARRRPAGVLGPAYAHRGRREKSGREGFD